MSSTDPLAEVPRSLTVREMLNLGINPTSPFTSVQRIVGKPFDVRFEDKRLVRSYSGSVHVYYGWYEERAIAARKYMAQKFAEKFNKSFREAYDEHKSAEKDPN